MRYARQTAQAAFLMIATALPSPARGEQILSLQDSIIGPGRHARLVAYLTRESLFGIPKDIEHTTVTFFAGCHTLGTANTGEAGMAILECPIPSDVPDEIRAEATYSGNRMEGAARLFHWTDRKIAVCIDIDDTISRTDLDDVLLDEEDDDSKPLRHSRETLQYLSEDYHIFYLTARPSFLLEKTRNWLSSRGFPAAPVIVSHRKRDLLQQAEYKERMLRTLQKDWPNILIGIGDKATDAQAYGERDMLAIIVRGKKPEEIGRHALIMPDWKTIHRFFRNNRHILTNAQNCRLAIAGKQPLLLTVNTYDRDEDD